MSNQLSLSFAWGVYHDSATPTVGGVFEHPAGCECQSCRSWNADKHYPYGSGLVLAVCPHCGNKQSRANYVAGFWAECVELGGYYERYGVCKCAKCAKWCKWYS